MANIIVQMPLLVTLVYMIHKQRAHLAHALEQSTQHFILCFLHNASHFLQATLHAFLTLANTALSQFILQHLQTRRHSSIHIIHALIHSFISFFIFGSLHTLHPDIHLLHFEIHSLQALSILAVIYFNIYFNYFVIILLFLLFCYSYYSIKNNNLFTIFIRE
jgi:hypothetical protein